MLRIKLTKLDSGQVHVDGLASFHFQDIDIFGLWFYGK